VKERIERSRAERFVSLEAALGVRAAAWCSTNSIFNNINTRSPDSPTERAQHCVMKIRYSLLANDTARQYFMMYCSAQKT